MTSRLLFAIGLALALVGGASDAQAQPPSYIFTDIGSLGGGYTYPYAVNEAGQIAVYSRTTAGTYHAALFSGGVLTDLTPGAYQSFPEWRGLNDAGHVFGRVYPTSGSCPQVFLYYNGTTRTFSIGSCDTYPSKMNASGQVIGWGRTSGGQDRAFVYTPSGSGGTLTLISLGGSYSYAYDINDAGVVVGYAQLPSGQYHAFRHDAATGVTTDMGTLGGSSSFAHDINSAGQITGWAYNASGYQRAFRWTPGGSMEDMGTLGGTWSEGRWIDGSGRVTGRSQTTSGAYRSYRSDGTTKVAIDPATSTGGYPVLATESGYSAGYYYPPASSTHQAFVYDGASSHALTSGAYAYPQDLTNNGHAAGYYYTDTAYSFYRGFLYDPATTSFHTVTLGGDYSFLDNVNDSGWAVGWANRPSSRQFAVLAKGSQIHIIEEIVTPPSGALLYDARHISNSGYVAGYGVWNGASRAFLLTPGSLDAAAPVSTGSAEPLPNAAVWANSDVTVTITADDETDGSGVKEIVYSATGSGAIGATTVAGDTTTFVISAEGETTITYFARDNAGNEETPQTLTVRLDKTAPSLKCVADKGFWNAENVTLGCTAADAVAGLANASDMTFSLTTSIAADTESANASTDGRIVCDLADNCATSGPITGIKVDRKRPEVTLNAPTATSYNLLQSVAADFACADTGSGIGTCSAPVADGSDIDTATAGAKTFTVTATDAVGNMASVSVTYTVLKGTPSVTWNALAPITYGTALGASQLNASSPVPGSFAYTPGAGAVLAAGTHPLSATFTPDDPANYNSITTPNSIEVTPAALTVTANNATKAYGAAMPTFGVTPSGLVNGDTLADLGGTLTFDTTANATSGVGTYPVTPSGLTSPNYLIAFADGTLTVTRAALVVTADDAAKAYGAPLPTFAASYAGLVNGDTAASLVGSLTFDTAATDTSAVSTYAITPGGLSSPNYEVSFANGTLTVTPVGLTVTANHASKEYGAPLPAFTAAISGFVNGDIADDLAGTLAYATPATAASAVGDYSVTPSGLNSPNYTVTFVAGTISVTPAPVIVTATNTSKVYGAPLPAFAAIYEGLVNGDVAGDLTGTLAFATPATPSSHVSSYSVTPSGLTSANYTVAFVDGVLTVTPAALVITAADKAMVLNGALPAFTANYAGFVNGDTPASLDVAPTLSSAATGAVPGSFPIVASGTADANYAISHVNGTLSIGYALAGNCLAGPGRTILQPINADGTSVFKKGSTVPAKFRVCDASGVAVAAGGTVTDFRLIQTQTGTIASVNEPVESTTPFNEFRWDATGQHWIFNMNTKSLSANTTYTFRVSLADGTWLDFRFGLR